MEILTLNGTWNLKGRNQRTETEYSINISAKVPGCVQLDLAEAGYLPRDLFMGENIVEAEKYEEYCWEYSRSFYIDEVKSNSYLVFEGVDCLAEYFLNGIKFAESKNMFVEHEFKVDSLLKQGENTLSVRISSATLAALGKDYPLRLLHNFTSIESNHVRKAPHSYGWDIMPRAVTAGLWRSVRLEMRDEVFFSQAFIRANSKSTVFYFTLGPDSVGFEPFDIEIKGSCKDSAFRHRQTFKKPFGGMPFRIDNPKLWYPRGYGDANVYDCVAEIYKNGKLVHSRKLVFGIRDIILDRCDPDGLDKGQFRFLINGTEIMCRGSNWVPLDAFHSRDAERYDKALELVRDIGCNILRCWGGNVYEDHKFFDFCDRNGIMVWQDFSMACAMYPEGEEFLENMRQEVTKVVRKLREHPSIVLWAGDNEVDACYQQFDPNANKITRQLIPECLRDNDVGRPYLASSPYISPRMHSAGVASQVEGSILPEDHLWGPRDYFKADFYKYNQAHFVSETGYHGCPSLESIKKFITPERVWPYHNNPEWILHSSDQRGNDERVMLMEKQVKQLFGEVPTDPESYILASQISQAEAKKYFIERIRVGRPDKTGIIWWNLLDGWPQMSDAVVDYYFTKKLAYSYIKRSQQEFAIAAGEITNWGLPIYACNDTMEKKQVKLTVSYADTDEVIFSSEFTVGENRSELIAKIPVYYSDKRVLIFKWEANGESGINHYLCGYPPFSLSEYASVMKKHGLL